MLFLSKGRCRINNYGTLQISNRKSLIPGFAEGSACYDNLEMVILSKALLLPSGNFLGGGGGNNYEIGFECNIHMQNTDFPAERLC